MFGLPPCAPAEYSSIRLGNRWSSSRSVTTQACEAALESIELAAHSSRITALKCIGIPGSPFA
jgi:hypothetical protein